MGVWKNQTKPKQRRNILRGVRLQIFSWCFQWQLFGLSWLNTERAEGSTLTCLSSLKTAVGPRVLSTDSAFSANFARAWMRGHKRCRISRRAEPRDVEAQIGESRFLTRSMASTDEGRVLCLAQMRSAWKDSGYLGNPNGTPENLSEGVRVSGTTDNYRLFDKGYVRTQPRCTRPSRAFHYTRNKQIAEMAITEVSRWVLFCHASNVVRLPKISVCKEKPGCSRTEWKKKENREKQTNCWTCKHIITLALAEVGKQLWQIESTPLVGPRDWKWLDLFFALQSS